MRFFGENISINFNMICYNAGAMTNRLEDKVQALAKQNGWTRGERYRRYGGELIGTFGIVFGAACSALVNTVTNGAVTLVGAALASGLAVTAMIYTVGHVCNAHFNPAVTIAFAATGHFRWKEVPGYILAQLGGAILAAFSLKLMFGDVAGLGGNRPSGNVGQAFGAEVIISFFLMFVILAVATDDKAVGQAAGLAIGLWVVVAILAVGPVSGASMNPVRSFGPALVAGSLEYSWLYWVAPIIGTLLGAFAYQFIRGDGKGFPKVNFGDKNR
jgi:aquaporin NIP